MIENQCTFLMHVEFRFALFFGRLIKNIYFCGV